MITPLQLLYDLAQAVGRAVEPNEVYRAAVEGPVGGQAADRASVMIFDGDGVMRFKAWKGISDRHRADIEGHVHWQRGDREAESVTIADVRQDLSGSPYLPTLEREGIGALALVLRRCAA